MKIIGMIPARLESSRLPGKLLKDICGLPLIIHVLLRAQMAKSLDEVYVATDSDKIREVVEKFGGKVIMTSPHHTTGTDRVAEAAKKVTSDIIVNIQGDEALLEPQHIDTVTQKLVNSPEAQVALLVVPYKKKNSPSDIKAVLDKSSNVMYLSREDIPSTSRTDHQSFLKAYHLVPFRAEFLQAYTSLEKTPLETLEFNEYLRILENGYKITAAHVESDCISVDTQEDLDYVISKMDNDEIFKLYRERAL